MENRRYKKVAESEGGLTLLYAVIWVLLILGTLFIAGLDFALSQIALLW